MYRSLDDCSCFTTHLCNVLLVQDHNKEDNNNLLRVCNTFNKYRISATLTVDLHSVIRHYINEHDEGVTFYNHEPR